MARMTPNELAELWARKAQRQPARWPEDGFFRETFRQPRDRARVTAKKFFNQCPKEADMPEVEFRHELPTGEIELTMRRLKSAD
jgi:hypothetical protein